MQVIQSMSIISSPLIFNNQQQSALKQQTNYHQ